MPKRHANPSALSPLSPGVLMWAHINRYKQAANDALKPYGISFQEFAALTFLVDEAKTTVFSQKELNAHLGMSEMNGTRLVRSLRKKNLIHYMPNSMFDRRANTLSATLSTLKMLEEATLAITQLDTEFSSATKERGIRLPHLVLNQS